MDYEMKLCHSYFEVNICVDALTSLVCDSIQSIP